MMHNREWGRINDTDFEALLKSAVPEFPPEDIVAEVTPWKKSINRVLVGMVLTAITLNFWCLNYILPAIGIILLLLGFRALRHENRWFGYCFWASIIRAAYSFPSLILNTTVIQSASAVETVLTITSLLLLLMQLVCLWRGFISVQQKAGLPPHAGGAVALIVWYTLMCLLAFIRYSGLIVVLAMLVGYFSIIRNLYKLSKELDEAGYAIRTAPIKITDRCIVVSLVSFLLLGSICGYVFGGSYSMKWTRLNSAEQDHVEEIKVHLMSLGFPEYVLNDLRAEDIEACEGALQVVVDVTDEPMNDGRVETTEYLGADGVRHMESKTVYDVKELRITGVGVQVPGERERWIIFHHFLWTKDPGFYGTEAIQLWPVYRDIYEGWHSAGDVTGRVLYDNKGETFTADYYSLGTQTFTFSTIFWGEQSSTDVFAAFSMPRDGSNHRGYIAYPVDEAQDGYIISSWFNYTHQQSWRQYPAMTAMEKRMTYGWNDAGAFKTVQDALQFDPSAGSAEHIS